MDRLAALKALSDDLLTWMQDAPVDRKAALIAQYRATLLEIETLSPPVKKAGDPIDEIAERRAARGAGSASGHGVSKSGSR